MSDERFVLCKKGDNEYIEDNGVVQLYGLDVICEMLNEQQAEIRLYQERVDTRVEQISIIKKHCLEMLSDEQITIIRNDLEKFIKDKSEDCISVDGLNDEDMGEERIIGLAGNGIYSIRYFDNEKLNEQQDLNFIINFQEKEIDSLKALLKEKEALTEENEQLRIKNCDLKQELDVERTLIANLRVYKEDYKDKLLERIKELEEKNKELMMNMQKTVMRLQLLEDCTDCKYYAEYDDCIECKLQKTVSGLPYQITIGDKDIDESLRLMFVDCPLPSCTAKEYDGWLRE